MTYYIPTQRPSIFLSCFPCFMSCESKVFNCAMIVERVKPIDLTYTLDDTITNY